MAMATMPRDSDFQRLPIQPEDGFPQAFVLGFADRLYRFTLSVSFLTLEPFKVWEIGGSAAADRTIRRSLSLPLSTSGARAPLPWEVQGEPERLIYTLPQEQLYLVMRVEREDLPEPERLLGVTRPVLGIPVRLGELVFLFKRILVARGNLLGPGNFGSEIVAGVATYGG
jgi:hypothetical protein